MVFPYLDSTGIEMTYHVKLDQPRVDKRDGKTIKYESPKGSSQYLYVPPTARQRVSDPKESLIITEGEKKALSAASRDYAVVGINGVWGWKQRGAKEDGDRLLADFGEIPLEMRQVVIAFDSDIENNHQIKLAEIRLMLALRARGASVRPLRLPAASDSGKVGLDDFLMAEGDASRERLDEMIATAFDRFADSDGCDDLLEITKKQAQEEQPTLLMLARAFLVSSQALQGGQTLWRYKREYHHWDGSRYRPIHDEEAEAKVFSFLLSEIEEKDVKPRLARTVLDCIRSISMLDSNRSAPFWIDGTSAGPDQGHIAMANGILDVERLMAGEEDLTQVLVPASPNWFSPIVLHYDFDPQADCLQWLSFLEEIFEGDEERISLVQEWFGYCLIPDCSQQKMLFAYGEGANGKSVVLATLTAVLGQDNVSSVPLEHFGQRFALMATIGKLANIVPEIGELDRVAEGTLKSFVAADVMTIDRKNRDPIAVRPTARMVLATNNLPRFTDRSDGVWRRMLLLPFLVQIPPEKQDKHLIEKLETELPGILNWSLVGLARLRQQGHFTEPAICRESLSDYRLESNPTRQFLQNHCLTVEIGHVEAKALYIRYREEMQTSGYAPLNEANFGKEIRRIFPTAARRKLGSRAQRTYVYDQLGWASESPVHDDF